MCKPDLPLLHAVGSLVYLGIYKALMSAPPPTRTSGAYTSFFLGGYLFTPEYGYEKEVLFTNDPSIESLTYLITNPCGG